MAKHLDSLAAQKVGVDWQTIWNKWVPEKINIFMWRVLRNGLPTRANLATRWVQIESIYCPIRYDNIEILDHYLLRCRQAAELWKRIYQWLQIDRPTVVDMIELVFDFPRMQVTSEEQNQALQVVAFVTTWALWTRRNE